MLSECVVPISSDILLLWVVMSVAGDQTALPLLRLGGLVLSVVVGGGFAMRVMLACCSVIMHTYWRLL